MALRFLSSSPNIAINFPSNQSKKEAIKVSMLHRRQKLSSSKQPVPSTKIFIQNLVYEEKSMGIICYKDEKGEIICEGFDEGPRYSRHTPEQEEEHHQRQRELLIPRFLQATKLRNYYVQDSSKDLDLLINTNFM